MSSNENGCVKDPPVDSQPFGVDDILVKIGQLGKYQWCILFVIFFIVSFNVIVTIAFAFTAGTLVYRCRVPECDLSNSSYEQPWTQFSIPRIANGKLEKCKRYTPFNSSHDGQLYCNAENYDQDSTQDCAGDFIFRDNEVTISNDFKIYCSDEWKLAMVGTLNNVGQFIGIPLGGYLSDKYGRRQVLTYGAVMSAFLGTTRSFSPNYYIYVILGLLDNVFGSSLYATAFVLAIELVGPKRRIIACSIIPAVCGFAGFLLALVAKNFPNWRMIERIFYVPALAFMALPWLLPESFRWLLAQGQEDKAIEVLKKTARINKRKLSESSIEKLLESNRQNSPGNVETENTKSPILAAFRVFPMRIVNCSLCWFTNIMIFFGLNLNLGLLGGDKYYGFMSVCLIEIPGIVLPFLTINRFGRRYSLCSYMILSGISIAAMAYVDPKLVNLQLVLYMLGKMAITASLQTLYFFTSEIFPTSIRNSLLSFCSMFGRFGSMVAPQTPLMAKYHASAPAILFASFAILSGSLSLFLPETKDMILPTTLEDAEKLGQKEMKEIKIDPEVEEKLLESKV